MAKANIENRTIFCKDNLDVMRGINSSCIDLIYLDPPFNKKKVFTAPIGSQAEGAVFSDIFRKSDIKDEWLELIEFEYPDIYKLIQAVKEISRTEYNWCYLCYMAIRLIECKRILKDSGSLYLHCDPTMSHYLKALLDCIFGEKNFKNEIVWAYKTGGTSKRYFSKKHDIILFYSKSDNYKFYWQQEKSYNRKFKAYNFKGVKEFKDEKGWYTKVGLKDYWLIDIVGRTSQERIGYPTQKPLALLERIIKASTKPGDIVLDPFCGCATTCVAAESLKRGWIGIDVSPKAYDLVKERLKKPVKTTDLENGQAWSFDAEIFQRTDIPQRTDQKVCIKLNYADMKRKLYQKQAGVCNLCQLNFNERNLEVDHIHPQSKGGSDVYSNRQLLCGYCNRTKADKSMEQAKAILRKKGILK